MSHYEFNAAPYKSGILVSGTSHNLVRIAYHADLNTARYLCQTLLNNMHTTLSFTFKIFLYTVEKTSAIFKWWFTFIYIMLSTLMFTEGQCIT